jgi:hypothetical protein
MVVSQVTGDDETVVADADADAGGEGERPKSNDSNRLGFGGAVPPTRPATQPWREAWDADEQLDSLRRHKIRSKSGAHGEESWGESISSIRNSIQVAGLFTLRPFATYEMSFGPMIEVFFSLACRIAPGE